MEARSIKVVRPFEFYSQMGSRQQEWEEEDHHLLIAQSRLEGVSQRAPVVFELLTFLVTNLSLDLLLFQEMLGPVQLRLQILTLCQELGAVLHSRDLDL